MRLPWHWRAEARRELADARAQREAAEEKLAEAREHVIIPLRELREKNHVSEAIRVLIQRGAQERPS
jgi:hypothetical protein